MPNPKRRWSSTRRDKRRTHDKIELPVIAICSNCKAPVRYHRVCPECGFYRNSEAVEKSAAK